MKMSRRSPVYTFLWEKGDYYVKTRSSNVEKVKDDLNSLVDRGVLKVLTKLGSPQDRHLGFKVVMPGSHVSMPPNGNLFRVSSETEPSVTCAQIMENPDLCGRYVSIDDLLAFTFERLSYMVEEL